jgi:serine-type D-Ala-D-Ala carboxypeptidase (penicillin-binding protein 5/6)
VFRVKQFAGLAVLAGAFLLAPVRAAAPDAPPPPLAPDAEVALLIDLSAGGQPLYLRAANKPFLPASITKAMSALVAFDMIRAGKLTLDQQMPVRAETLARWAPSGTSMQLVPGEQVAVRDLLMGMTTVSANDAAAVLAEGAAGSVEAWVGLMNAAAARRGMRSSHFATPNGLPDHGLTEVSAPDLVRLADALIYDYPEFYHQFIGQRSFTWHGVTQLNHDPTIGVVPGADGIKTGHTFEAGFTFLGSAKRGDRRLVLVTARSQTEPGRAAAARDLLEWGFNAWDSRPLLGARQLVGRAMVQQGNARSVALIAPRAFSLALPKDARPPVSARIRYDGPVKAPIRQGAAIARLDITVGTATHSLPLVAGENVAIAGPIDRMINGLVGLFR